MSPPAFSVPACQGTIDSLLNRGESFDAARREATTDDRTEKIYEQPFRVLLCGTSTRGVIPGSSILWK